MANTWYKLKKSLSQRLSSRPSISCASSSSSHQSSDFAFDISEVDLAASSTPTGSSIASRLPRSSSVASSSSRYIKKTCAICLGKMKPGQGHAIFTAECSHAFHFNCIASSVKHGNQLCPICRSAWKDVPFQAPAAPRVTAPYLPNPTEPLHFSDDEPLLTHNVNNNISPSTHQILTIKAFPEFPAVIAPESSPAFPVLVGIQARPLALDAQNRDRAPIDLVTVLDVSGSMYGEKLTLLKQAVCFVIQNLGPADRLSIVTFSSRAQRIFPLRRMSSSGRESAIRSVNSLWTRGGTSIIEGLNKGVRVLEERREQNPVSSIILLSDGKDNFFDDNIYRLQRRSSTHSRSVDGFLSHLPSSIRGDNGDEATLEPRRPLFPVHTFGFGSDHDSATMHAVSDASGGTFSFVHSAHMIQDAFARCIGGLLSVVAQDVKLSINSISPGITIASIRHPSEISSSGLQGVIDVGDLYADEEKCFLVHVSVPVSTGVVEAGEYPAETVPTTPLLSVECVFQDPLMQSPVQVRSVTVEIQRPQTLSPEDNKVSLEVDREINRLEVVEAIEEAHDMAEKGNLEGAQALLENRRAALLTSASSRAGDAICNWLEVELKEIMNRMENQDIYDYSGRPYMLSGLSSHLRQRATTRGDSMTQSRELENLSQTQPLGYETPSMVTMVMRSQTLSFPLGHPPEEPVSMLSKTGSMSGGCS